jgi:hypothetical protein
MIMSILYYKKEILSLKKIIFIFLIPISIYFEERNFEEEKSKNKIMSRIYSIIINILVIVYLEYFDNDMDFFVYLLIFINGYFILTLFLTSFIEIKLNVI